MKENFLRLVRLGIGTETVSGFKFHDSIDWGEVEALATKQGLLAVVLDGIQLLPEDQRPPKVQMLQWIGQVMQGYEQRYVEYRKAIATSCRENLPMVGRVRHGASSP